MKKFLVAVFTMLITVSASAYALEDPDLIFDTTDGKYIYCNNYESLRKTDLADLSNENPRYIMTNYDMGPDKYSMFVSHINKTETKDEKGNITAPGFDIEIDVLFKATEDTTITFNSIGFEVPKNGMYRYNGRPFTYEDEWGCFNCWATYLKMPIRQLDSGTTYSPTPFEPVTVTIKAGEIYWISDITPDYAPVPYKRPMNLMADFDIVSGKCEIDVAALKSTGTLKDRSQYAPNSAFGIYDRDHQYKGVANSMNEVNSKTLNYVVDNSSWHNQNLGVKVYNPKYPNGNDINVWYTHLNPLADQWSGDKCAESDMLAFDYYDPSKLSYYGAKVSENKKDDVWHFDTRHSDTSKFSTEYGFSKSAYIPNWELPKDRLTGYACNLGNYGVKVNYNISVDNQGDMTRYFNYDLATASNNVVYATDKDGNLIDGYALCKGTETIRVSDDMFSIELPAHTVTDFTITVILTTFNPGGMENSFVLKDYRTPTFVYHNEKQEITTDKNFDGYEHYLWHNGNLCFIESGRVITLPEHIQSDINGNWSEYRVFKTDNGYVIKPGIYDGIPSYSHDFFKTVYFFDNDFNYLSEYKFKFYPSAYTSINGVHFVNAGSVLYSLDGRSWTQLDTKFYMPCSNHGKFGATVSKDNKIYLTADGINFEKVKYQDFKGDYIDSIGNVYYYAKGKNLYLSTNGIYWEHHALSSDISTVNMLESGITVNGEDNFSVPKTDAPIIKLKNEYLGFTQMPYEKNNTTYVPLRFLCESLGASVSWENGFIIIDNHKTQICLRPNDITAYVNGKEVKMTQPAYNNGTAFVPLRFICENLGYGIEIENGIITVK